jgi:hypothetical protein
MARAKWSIADLFADLVGVASTSSEVIAMVNAQLAIVGLRGRPEAAALIAQGNGVMAATA